MLTILIYVSSIFNLNLTFSFVFLILNNKMLVLSIFKDNLLIFNQLYDLSMPCFILFSRFIRDLSLQIKVVSSENKICLKTGDIFGR